MILLLPITPIPALLQLIQLRVRQLLPPTLRLAMSTRTPLSLAIQLNNSNHLIQQMEVSCSSIQLQIHKFTPLKLVVAIRPLRLSRPVILLKPDSYRSSTQLTQPIPLSPTLPLAILQLLTNEFEAKIVD